MSEHFISQATSPAIDRASLQERLDLITSKPKGTLGELVVTDPRDPFIWLRSQKYGHLELISESGKQLLWMIYRMNGNFPQNPEDVKWRDQRQDMDEVIVQLSPADIACAKHYQRHLASIAEKSIDAVDTQDN